MKIRRFCKSHLVRRIEKPAPETSSRELTYKFKVCTLLLKHAHERSGRNIQSPGGVVNRIFKSIMLSASTAALAAGAFSNIALAQDAAPSETVEVTGSRINLAGFQSPTPVQMISAEQMQQN